MLADRWEGKRFNSPNDVVRHSSGAIYFTDPPYGLEKGGDAATREIDFNGVYRVAPDGTVTLVTKRDDQAQRPGVLARREDAVRRPVRQHRAAVAGVPRERRRLARRADGVLRRHAAGPGRQAASPDGFKVDEHGNLFATGPGGVLVISPEGKHLGTISTGDLVVQLRLRRRRQHAVHDRRTRTSAA